MESDDTSTTVHINTLTNSSNNAENFIVYSSTLSGSHPPGSILLVQLGKLRNNVTTYRGTINLAVLESWSKVPPNTGKSLTALCETISKSLGSQPDDHLLRIEASGDGAMMIIKESLDATIGQLLLKEIPVAEGIFFLIHNCMEVIRRCNTAQTLSNSKTLELQQQVKSLEDLLTKFTVEKNKNEDRIFRAVKHYVDEKKDRIKQLERQLNHEVPESNDSSETDVEESGSENEEPQSRYNDDNGATEAMDVEQIIPNDSMDDINEVTQLPTLKKAKSKPKPLIKDSSSGSDTDFDDAA